MYLKEIEIIGVSLAVELSTRAEFLENFKSVDVRKAVHDAFQLTSGKLQGSMRMKYGIHAA